MKLAQKLALGYIRGRIRILSLLSAKKAALKAFDIFCTPHYRNRGKRPPIFKEAELIRTRFQNFTLTGYRWNKGAGRKVLIIHGFESSVINFDRYVKPLIRKGYEVLAFDAPAHGRSTGKRLNALIFRDFILFMNQEYGPIQSYMAHSFGGLALCLAMEQINIPDRRLVLIAPLTETTSSMKTFFEMLDVSLAVQKSFSDLITDMSGQPPAWYSIRRAIRNIDAKVLWFHDSDDQLTPLSDALKVKEDNNPHVEFVISEGLGHRRIYRDNQVKKRTVDFL